MPRRTDISSVLVIGSGPIIIGQACEFDYSGTQACRVLRAEGLRVALVNSNPATIMTDPDIADATYVEPITPEFVTKVIERERPDALLPTLGGQTALNTAVALAESGVLERYGVELIGASLPAIHAGEDREAFAKILKSIGAESPRSATAHTVEEALAIGDGLGYPVVVRPSFTLGGGGAGFAHDRAELATRAAAALAASPTHETLVEESVLGWKEYELEVVRDRADNCIVVCAIENLDPMGVHTGDSITVAPVLTLTDPEYQKMRDTAFAVIRAVGVDTGGSNIQFAVDPVTGRQVVIEMNPRVSRSSALASKATGFPIAKIAARLAIGYTLDEITNDVTGTTPASFEPAMDQVVVKVPRFNFDKFPGADDSLGMRMHSVGEVMALGRTFPEALQKALRSMEESGSTLSFAQPEAPVDELLARARRPHPRRLHDVRAALAAGASISDVAGATGIDPWFVDQICSLNEIAEEVRSAEHLSADLLRSAKRHGFADTQIAQLRGSEVSEVRHLRWHTDVRPVYKTVDTCAAEFAANTPYMYSAYEDETETVTATRETIIILGSGPNRIGQGVEFDYACVHAALALGEAGYDTVMINCNPETVSTDYDTSDRLYFEPLTAEDVLEVVHAERASGKLLGVILTLGGQTPLALAQTLQEEGVPILGTSPASIDAAEDREVFGRLLADCGLVAPEHRTAVTVDGALAAAEAIGYPVMVRPNYVLGGAGMAIVYDRDSLLAHLDDAQVSERNPLLVDRFLDDAIEVDVDAVFDGHELYCGGIMEHIEEAGIHSGDSACALPPISLGRADRQRIREATEVLARALGVRGLLNVQYAIAGGVLHVLEANPRASRSVPFVSKATGVALAKIAARVMAGQSLAELRTLDLLPDVDATHQLASAPVAVKEAVLPWNRFAGVDSVLGPQMRSTGEVMGIDRTFGNAYAKSQEAAYGALPSTGTVFVSVADRDKRSAILPIGRLADLGFTLLATEGTAEVLARHGIESTVVRKHTDGRGPQGEPTIVDMLHDGQVDLVVNTPFGVGPRRDGYEIRTAAVTRGVACVTTVQALAACVQAIESRRLASPDVHSLQDYAEAARQGRSI